MPGSPTKSCRPVGELGRDGRGRRLEGSMVFYAGARAPERPDRRMGEEADSQGAGQLCLAHSRWAQEDQVGRGLHKAEGGQFADEPLRHPGLEAEVKALPRLTRWQPCGAESPGMRALTAARHFSLQRQPQERVIGGLSLTRLLQDRGQGRAQRGQPQRFEDGNEVVVCGRGKAHWRTSMRAAPNKRSYSPRSRSATSGAGMR